MLPSIFGENMMDGDVEVSDLVNTEPFNNYDIAEIFGAYLTVVSIVGVLHNSIVVNAE